MAICSYRMYKIWKKKQKKTHTLIVLENHVVISEQPEKSVQYKQKNGFQKDMATFAGLQKQF